MLFLSDEPFGQEMVAQEFPGMVWEKRIFAWVLLKLLSSAPSSISERRHTAISISLLPDQLFKTEGQSNCSSSFKQKLLEKALYRLLLLGAIEGYERREGSFEVCLTICQASNIYSNYQNYINRFETESRGRDYLPQRETSSYKKAALHCGCKLIEYSYSRIKMKREDDLVKMDQIMQAGRVSPKRLQESLHEFVHPQDIGYRLDHLPGDCCWQVFEGIEGLDELLGLLLACREKLRLQPDDAALRIVAGLCALALAFPDNGRAQIDLSEGFAGLKSLNAPAYRADAARQIVGFSQFLMPSKMEMILEIIWRADPSADMARLCYERSEFGSDICYSSLYTLVNGVLQSFQTAKVNVYE